MFPESDLADLPLVRLRETVALRVGDQLQGGRGYAHQESKPADGIRLCGRFDDEEARNHH